LELYEGTQQDGKLIFTDGFEGYSRMVESFVVEGIPSTDTSSVSAGVGISSIVGVFLLSWLI
jgi:hypothetical protein